MRPKRILITGATGLIGKEVGKKLIEHGHQLSVVSRNPNRARMELPFPARVFKWSGESEEFPQAALDEVDAVVHLAGESIADGRWSEERKKRIRDSRVIGTQRLVDAIAIHSEAKNRIKVFVQGSAIGYYGSRGDEVLNESSTKGEDFLADVVADWEVEADRLASVSQAPDFRLVKLRTGIVLSRHGGALAKMLPLFQKGLGGKLASGQQWMSWIHIEDIASLFAFSVENEDARGVINGSAPEPARNDRFTVALARAVGRPVFLPVPESALKIAFGEMSQALLGSQRVVPERALELGFQFRFPELVPALEQLGETLKAGQHELFAEQWVPMTPEEVFPFFCSELNLEALTPQFLNFKVLGKSTDKIEEGTLIDYRLSLHGIPMKWRTRIEEWQPNKKFVDVQLKGPYRRWHHTHEFIPFAGGTLLRDRVLYQLPMGWLGDTAAGWKVGGDVGQIFAFRRQQIDTMFGEKTEKA
jgi:uncharacterized protein